MKTWEEINVNEPLPIEDFTTLFSRLPLSDTETHQITEELYPIYQRFLECGVIAEEAWIAVKNIFVLKKQVEEAKTI